MFARGIRVFQRGKEVDELELEPPRGLSRAFCVLSVGQSARTQRAALAVRAL
jgi:hypothetical protein